MALYISATHTTGANLFATLSRLDTGEHWNQAVGAWGAGVPDANRKIPLTEGTGIEVGSYTATVTDADLGDAGEVRVRIHDDDDVADAVIGGGMTWIYGAAEVPAANARMVSDDAAAADALETMLDGTGGSTLSLKQLNIVNSAGSALVAQSTGGNGHGIAATGQGSGEGISAQGGATGSGIQGIGGATSGQGIMGQGGTSGIGIYGLGQGSGIGIAGEGGSTGHGIVGAGHGNGSGVRATGAGAGDGMELVAGPTGVDLDADVTVTALAAAAIQSIWDRLTSALTTAGSIGKLLVDNITGAIPTAAQVWSYSSRTLTQSAAQVTAAVDGSDIVIRQSDRVTIALTGLGALTDRTKLWFTIKKTPKHDADTASILQIEETAGLLYLDGAAYGTAAHASLTVDDAAAGDITIVIEEQATALLPTDKGEMKYDIKRLGANGPVTMTEGAARVTVHVTRSLT